MVRTVKLSDGSSMPAMGWGNMGGKEKALNAGAVALKAGILHIDSAQIYRTEAEVASAIEKAGMKREDVYVTTKLINMPDQPKLHSLEELKASVNRSLTQIGFIPNLLLIHNPHVPAAGHLTEFWGWLEDLVEDGTLKGCSLGLSNFRPVDVEEIMRVARVKPVVNQIEYHPYVMVHVAPLLDLHKKYNIITQAYGALAPTTGHPTGGPIIPVLERIAANLTKETGVEVDTSGVLMLWIMTQGGVCITSSGSEERIKKMSDLEKVRDLNDGELREIEEAGSRIHWRQRPEHLVTDFPAPDLPEDV